MSRWPSSCMRLRPSMQYTPDSNRRKCPRASQPSIYLSMDSSTQERPSKRKKTITKETTSPLDQQLILALRDVTRAAKKAKAFEIQHMVRKLRLAKEGKPLSKKPSTAVDPKDLEADLNSFKSINVENLSKKILYTRLKRQSSELMTHSTFQDFQDLSGPIQFERIENKISSQKSLSEVIKQTVTKLLLAHLRPDPVEKIDSKAKECTSKAKNSQQRTADTRVGSSDQSGSEDEGELLGDALDEAVARELAGLEAGPTSEEMSESEESQLSRTDDDDEHSDSHSDCSRDSQTQSGHSSSSTSFHHPAPAKKPKLAKPPASKTTTRPSSSTFLPALNVGYTLGDSDASDLDIDDQAVDKMEQERGRKNRRGQQARRAIWEKKYGKSAKHLVKLKQKSSTHPDKPAKAEERHRGKSKPSRSSGTDVKVKSVTGSNSEPLATLVKKPVDPKLHPSWIAKQNQIKNLSVVKPAGKKIVFD
ncbi:hypothetical protein PTTG_06635 [Puccinia triticina 1-1 BBBD Race 1]|uniref:BUD22 domain-containing protein n=2 Tax=Puccinia triticina TaxID=208348 RepID=A0A180GIH8_PUCT1|nr:hypothetical protein PTTG_06635 [Puccinia triticina 1-1 BBBD Race 1]